jgi:AAA family ATP:ADP antiporter
VGGAARAGPTPGQRRGADGGDILGGLKLIAREPLLRWLAVTVVLGVGVGTLLYNEQAAIARAAFSTADQSTRYFSGIDLAVNGLTLLVQLLLTRMLLTRYGLAPALLIPGAAIVLGYAALAASPLPMMVAIVQVVTRAGEFSLAKPARETIYTRVPRQWRYKAGAAIDTVIYRGGDLSFVWLHKLLSAFGSQMVFAAGLVVAAAMTVGALGVLRQASKLPAERPSTS